MPSLTLDHALSPARANRKHLELRSLPRDLQRGCDADLASLRRLHGFPAANLRLARFPRHIGQQAHDQAVWPDVKNAVEPAELSAPRGLTVQHIASGRNETNYQNRTSDASSLAAFS